MQAIELYIKNESGSFDRIEMFKDESVSITQSIKNAKDVSKVFTTFSKEFTVPASKTNNKIFEHYYNYSIVDGFDARIRKDSKIELNRLPFRSGKLRLNGVDMKDNKPFAYRLTFFGSIVELKDVLGEDKLFSLSGDAPEPLLNIDKGYSSAEIRAALASPVDADGCLIPLVTHSQRLYYDSLRPSEQSGNLFYDGTNQGVKFSQLKYAIRLKKILDAIENKYSEINFASGSFFKDMTTYPEMNNIFMWCHRKKAEIDIEAGPDTIVPFNNEQWQPSTVLFAETLNNKLIVRETRSFNTVTVLQGAVPTSRYDVVIKKNGEIVKAYIDIVGLIRLDGRIYEDTVVSINDEYEIIYRLYEESVEFTLLRFEYDRGQNGGVYEFASTIEGVVLQPSFVFNIAANLPEQKIIDFLSSLFKMFNLVAYVNDSGEIDVKPLDDFYANTQHNISEYIDVKDSKVDAALPYKEIFFKYKDTKTILAEQHLQILSDVEWGGNEYTDTGNIDGPIYKVEPDFHHAKYERLLDLSDTDNDSGIQYGYFVTDDENAHLGSPLLMYVGLQSLIKDMGFLSRTGVVLINSVASINMPSNVEIMTTNTSKTLHFGVERNEFTNVEATNSLFERYYKSYIQNVFNPLTRLTKVRAMLPLAQIINIELSDIIIIGDRQYRINSMTTNLSDGKTDFELINYYD